MNTPNPTPNPTPDPAACPLCGKPNECANEAKQRTGIAQPECWCTRSIFSAELLARVPAPALRLACICPACAAADVNSKAGRPAAP